MVPQVTHSFVKCPLSASPFSLFHADRVWNFWTFAENRSENVSDITELSACSSEQFTLLCRERYFLKSVFASFYATLVQLLHFFLGCLLLLTSYFGQIRDSIEKKNFVFLYGQHIKRNEKRRDFFLSRQLWRKQQTTGSLFSKIFTFCFFFFLFTS